MTLSFNNAPLVELIAELRWNQLPQMGAVPAPPAPQGIQQPTMFVLGHNAVEEFLMRVGGEVYQRGYRLAERLVPPGFPIMPSQAVCRYRSSDANKASTMYQAGFGTFTVNAVPPYKSWEEFAPVVAGGVDALLAARQPEGNLPQFLSVSLRYIDAFRETLTEGHDVSSFLSDVLGFTVGLPEVVSRKIAVDQKAKPSIQLSVPLANGMRMDMGIGEGMVNNEGAVLMDTTVSAVEPVEADRDAIMAVMNAAHDIIHEVFMEVTKPIQGLMQPNERG